MKTIKKIKALFSICLLLTVLGVLCGCAAEKTPYEINDSENYTVSVKYDANGGIFTTNTSVIVDSYNLEQLPKDFAGNAQIALIAPDNTSRGNDAFTAVNNGYFLAGWYAERVETLGGDGKAEFVYGSKWDFEKDTLSVDANKAYSASEPVLTLYAAWVPMFEIEFYDLSTGAYMESYTFNPATDGEILIPAWNTETGAVDMHDFPTKSGFTFSGVYSDPEGKLPLEGASVAHPGVVDYTNGAAKNPKLKLYVDYTEGEWFHIYSVEQFLDNASVSGNYVIHADLDFTDENWPSSMMHGNFSGIIQGNGHVFKNISFEQTNNSKVNSGLFGHLTEKSQISDLTFENVTFTIKSGTRVAGASFGLLAGTVSEGAAISNVKVLNSALQIDSSCYFGTDDYVIGLVCGMGDAGVDHSSVTCKAVGEKPESVVITLSGNAVNLSFTE